MEILFKVTKPNAPCLYTLTLPMYSPQNGLPLYKLLGVISKSMFLIHCAPTRPQQSGPTDPWPHRQGLAGGGGGQGMPSRKIRNFTLHRGLSLDKVCGWVINFPEKCWARPHFWNWSNAPLTPWGLWKIGGDVWGLSDRDQIPHD